MGNSLEYFIERHKVLKENYGSNNGKGSENCTLIAFKIKRILSDEGKKPYIIALKGKKIDSVGNRHPITPRVYSGRITWGAHVICCEGKKVYDPMLSSPISLRDYLKNTFKEKVDVIRLT